jgi:hypothetical protein
LCRDPGPWYVYVVPRTSEKPQQAKFAESPFYEIG